MARWTNEQLEFLKNQDDFYVSPFYSDGKTYGTPTFIWSVIVESDLYIRAGNGKESRWYQAAVEQKAGRMILNNEPWEVYYIPIDTEDELTEKINRAYETKYEGSSYLSIMTNEGPVEATVKVLPRED